MIGAYIHIPFCKNICNYCDFCKMYYNQKYLVDYLDNLKKEIENRYQGEIIDSLYIGGGTPSCLTICELDNLLSILSIFKLKTSAEYTIECNIEDIDIDKLNLFKSYGINRLSIGVQSFNKDNIKVLGRHHNEDMVFDNIYLAKKYFDNISIDLMYGIDEDIEKVKTDISKFLILDINHVSCYSLILEENTRLYIDRHSYISEDIDREMFDYICDTLTKNGYKHYEVSNYAREGYESIHNKNYWLNGEYYGFGLGAVSYIDNNRITNTKNMSKYISSKFIDNISYENINMRKENDLILGLRLIDGLSISKFNNKYEDDILGKFIIKELVNDGYLEVYEDKLKCNYKYIYVLNNILEKIIGSEL